MTSNTAELNPRADSSLAPASDLQANELDLYDELLVFSDLSPEARAPDIIINPPPQPPLELVESSATYEAQQPAETAKERPLQSANAPSLQLDDEAFFFQPPPEPIMEEVSFQMVEPRAVETIERKITEPAPVFKQPQQHSFDKDGDADFQLAELLRATGPLLAIPAKRSAVSSSLVCQECGCAAESEEMFCIACGGLLEESAPEATPSQSLSCDECGSEVTSDEIFCPSCGSVM